MKATAEAMAEYVTAVVVKALVARPLRLCLAIVLLGCASTHAAEYQVTELPFFPNGINTPGQVATNGGVWTPATPNGTTGTVAGPGGVAINDYGQTTASNGQFDYLYTPTTPNGSTYTSTLIQSVDRSDYTSVSGISGNGAVTGEWNPGIMSALNWLPTSANGTTGTNYYPQIGDGSSSTGYGINNAHQIVGTEVDITDRYGGAFLFTPQGFPGNGTTTPMSGLLATAINNFGQVVSVDTQNLGSSGQAYLFTPSVQNGVTGSTVILGLLPGALSTNADALNNLGQVVGNSGSAAFLWTTGDGIVNLNNRLDPISGAGWVLQSAAGINDAGQIVGIGLLNGVVQGYLLTPVPEPSSFILALAGLALLCGFRGRRR